MILVDVALSFYGNIEQEINPLEQTVCVGWHTHTPGSSHSSDHYFLARSICAADAAMRIYFGIWL